MASSAAAYSDRLLHGSPLRRPRVAVAIAVVLSLLIAFVALQFCALLGSLRPDVESVFLRALGLSSLLSLVPLAILWFLDRRERETPWLFAAAFLWGGFIATGLAIPLNGAIFKVVAAWLMHHPAVEAALGEEAVTLIVAPIAGPLVEEVTKGIGLVLLFVLLRAEFDNMRDGFVYGALVGLGFTWLEAPLYVAQGYAEYGVAPWGLQLGWRYALFGMSGHAMFTGIFGAFLGLALQTRRRWLKWLAPPIGLLLAIAAHTLNNVMPLIFAVLSAAEGQPPAGKEPPPDIGFLDAWLQGSLVDLTLFLPFVAIVALVLWRSGRWERQVIREELAPEVGRSVTPDEYASIEADGMFRTRRIDRGHRRLSADLVNAQHELAFRKRRVRDERGDPERDPLVAGWRGEIERLRRAGA